MNRSRGRQPRGFTIVYGSIVMFAMLAMVSLAVDWGRVQTAKAELQSAADAAARAGAAGLNDGNSKVSAQTAAAYNKADGQQVSILTSDVETGYWDVTAKTFVLGGSPTDTVRVTVRRTASRGNAVPLIFGAMIGKPSVDISAVSVCRTSRLAAVGINSVSITGSSGNVRRKLSENGGVTVASNGTYTFGSSSNFIDGDAFYRTTAPTGTVNGRLIKLPNNFSFPMPTVPSGAVLVSGNYTLMNYAPTVSGDYYVTGNLYVTTGGNIVLNGDTNIYVAGSVTFDNSCNVTTNGYSLVIYSTGSNPVLINNTANLLEMAVYAPASAVTVSGSYNLRGSAVGLTLSITTTLAYASHLAIPLPAGGNDAMMSAGGVALMK